MNNLIITFASQFQNTKAGLTTRCGQRTIPLFVLILGIVAATSNVLAQKPTRQKKVIPETVARSLAERFMQAYVNADLQMLHNVLLLPADPRCGTSKESNVQKKCAPPLIQHSMGTGMLSIRLRMSHEDTNHPALQWRSLWGKDECLSLIDEASSPWATIMSIKLEPSAYSNETNVWVADCSIKLLRDFGRNEKGKQKLNYGKSYYEKEEQHRLRVAFSFLPLAQGWKIDAVRPPYNLQLLFQADSLADVKHWLEISYTDDPYFLHALSSAWIHNIQIPAKIWDKADRKARENYMRLTAEESERSSEKMREASKKNKKILEDEQKKQEEEIKSLFRKAMSGKLPEQEIESLLEKPFGDILPEESKKREEAYKRIGEEQNKARDRAKARQDKFWEENKRRLEKAALRGNKSYEQEFKRQMDYGGEKFRNIWEEEEAISEDKIKKIREEIERSEEKEEKERVEALILLLTTLSEKLTEEEFQKLGEELKKVEIERLKDEEKEKVEAEKLDTEMMIKGKEAHAEQEKTRTAMIGESEKIRTEMINQAETEQIAAVSAVAEFCLKNAKTVGQRETILLNLAESLSPEKDQSYSPSHTVGLATDFQKQISFTVAADTSARLIAESSAILARKEQEVQQERDAKKKQGRIREEVALRTALGLFYWRAGQLLQAAHCFEQNLGRDEETEADSLLRLTHILLQMEKYDQTLHVAEQAKSPLLGKNAVQIKTVKLMAQTGILLNRGELDKVRKILAEGASEVKELCKGISHYECNNSKKLIMRYRLKLALLQGNQLEALAVLAETFDGNFDSNDARANMLIYIFSLLLPGIDEDQAQSRFEESAVSFFEEVESQKYKSCEEYLVGNPFIFREWPTKITTNYSKTANKTVKNLPLISGIDIAERLTRQIGLRRDKLWEPGFLKDELTMRRFENYQMFEFETSQLQSRNSALTNALLKILEIENYRGMFRDGPIPRYEYENITEKVYQYLAAAEDLHLHGHQLLATTIKLRAMELQIIMLEDMVSEPKLIQQTEGTLKEVCEFYRSSGMREELVASLHLRARALHRLQLLDEASACLDEAIKNVEWLRKYQFPLAYYTPEIAGKYAEVYHTAMAVNADLATRFSIEKKEPQRVYALQEKALKMADSIKSRALYDSLSTRTAHSKNDTAKDDVKREKLALPFSPIPELEQEIQSLVKERSNPPWAESLEPALLVPDQRTKVLSFTITDGGIHLFVLSRSVEGEININPYFQAFDAAPFSNSDKSLGKSELEETVEKFRQSLEDIKKIGYKALANQLAKMLWGDALPAELKEGDHLIIVPDGILWGVPFAALMPGDFHLIDKFTLSYAPSLGTLQKLKKQSRTCQPNRAGRELVLMVPNQITAQNANSVNVMVEKLKKTYPVQALEVVRLQKGTPKTEIKKWLGSCESVIQILNHAQSNDDDPMSSHISLSDAPSKANSLSNPSSSTGNSSRLTLGDIINLPAPIQADTVILTACKTGLGKFRLGESPLSLAWGFLQAGSRRCIATTWDVNAEVTMDLSTNYHALKKLATGLAANASALQKAQLEIKKLYPHPYFWAGFALWGIE